jgi:hypothetical protein
MFSNNNVFQETCWLNFNIFPCCRPGISLDTPGQFNTLGNIVKLQLFFCPIMIK